MATIVSGNVDITPVPLNKSFKNYILSAFVSTLCKQLYICLYVLKYWVITLMAFFPTPGIDIIPKANTCPTVMFLWTELHSLNSSKDDKYLT